MPRDFKLLGSDSEDVKRKAEIKISSEAIYQDLLGCVLMLYLGEEIPPIGIHPEAQGSLNQAHPRIFPSENHSSTRLPDIFWSSHLMKSFEPILLDLVAEDGNGTSRMLILFHSFFVLFLIYSSILCNCFLLFFFLLLF